VNRPLLLRGGLVFDGGGAEPVHGSVLLNGERIEWVGGDETPAEAAIIDCTNLAIAPGFIDGHSHSDLQVMENRPEKLRQGVTAEVVGNCGFSPFPAPPDLRPLHDFANGIFCGSGEWGWATAGEYLRSVEESCLTGVLALVGHGTLRIRVAGQKLGQLDIREQGMMEGLLDDALSAGASGLSTGLMYSPGASAPTAELERLCAVVARHGRVYATHMRDYGDHLAEAVEEQLELARRTGCRLQISHLQAVGARNWNRQTGVLERIESARDQGVDVAFDCYPYGRGSTMLTQLLPQWALEGGTAEMTVRLAQPGARALIAEQTEEALAQGWEGILISSVISSDNQRLVGKTIAEIANARGLAPVETALDLLLEERGQVNILEINQSDGNLRYALTHPLSNIVSDGFYVRGRPHPRLYGTFPRLLGNIARDQGWMTMAEAVRKITSLPAERFGISRSGWLKPGFQADITVFDPRTVRSAATYEDPDVHPNGIMYVFRRGHTLLSQGTECVRSKEI
jgi:dihydroorotase/N-acyl-D-amino-acid deacylase